MKVFIIVGNSLYRAKWGIAAVRLKYRELKNEPHSAYKEQEEAGNTFELRGAILSKENEGLICKEVSFVKSLLERFKVGNFKGKEINENEVEIHMIATNIVTRLVCELLEREFEYNMGHKSHTHLISDEDDIVNFIDSFVSDKGMIIDITSCPRHIIPSLTFLAYGRRGSGTYGRRGSGIYLFCLEDNSLLEV